MVDLNSNLGTGEQGSFRFKWPFLHSLILIPCIWYIFNPKHFK